MIQIGPFSAQVVAIAAAVILAWSVPRFLLHRVAPEQRKAAAGLVFDAFFVGLIAARLGYIVRWWSDYMATPLSIIAIGDAGFYWWAGLPAGLAFVAWRTRSMRPLRKPALGGIAVGLMVWGLAQGTLAIMHRAAPSIPALALQTLDKRTVSLDAYTGRPVVLNLWATWCPPCQREMPVLARAQQRHPDVDFVLINQGEKSATVQRFLQQRDLRFRHMLLDPNSSTLQAMKSRGLPTTLFFGADGKLVKAHMGEITAARLNDVIQHYFQSPVVMQAPQE